MGFGISVVQRLCKTSVKKNLYWEVKDKIIEESYNGVRMEKRPKRVKVYGVDSTKDVRARLIEILMERVMYHKDKFVAPIIHNEMQSMQVKKSGKVEHSDNSHDDQVFSYLMALYVWYEGKNLMENFGIRKSSIKTDTEEELDELPIEDSLEKREKVDFRSAEFESNEEISRELEWVEKDAKTFITSSDLEAEQYLRKIQQREIIMSKQKQNPDELNTVVLSYSTGNSMGYSPNVDIPTAIFDMDNDTDLFDEDSTAESHYLQGNLAAFYNDV